MSTNNDNLAWTVPASATSSDHLTQASLPIPAAGSLQVLVRLTAASLNYRDLLVVTRSPEYPGNHVANLVPCSEGAGLTNTKPRGRYQIATK
jgi:NADPH:quinone reductase-like Zn-dependent oxidoreductase